MPYVPNTAEDQRAMLEAIGVSSIEELFAAIPPELRLSRPLEIPPALSELELTAHLAAPRAASSTPRTRPTSPRPARATCRSSSSTRR
jgi:glycine dehydrogenase subunit 1